MFRDVPWVLKQNGFEQWLPKFSFSLILYVQIGLMTNISIMINDACQFPIYFAEHYFFGAILRNLVFYNFAMDFFVIRPICSYNIGEKQILYAIFL